MANSLPVMMKLLEEIAAHLQANTARDRSAAMRKLDRITALSSTLSLTVELRR